MFNVGVDFVFCFVGGDAPKEMSVRLRLASSVVNTVFPLSLSLFTPLPLSDNILKINLFANLRKKLLG